MTTIVERDNSSAEASSAMTMIVAIVALAVIVGLVLYVLGLRPFTQTETPTTGDDGGSINLSLGAGGNYK